MESEKTQNEIDDLHSHAASNNAYGWLQIPGI
jgi:hypothetical protein